MKKHGLCYSRIYGIWNGIINRCENPNRKAYSRYGGRGIKVCEEWHDFINFYNWAINNGYQENLSIDRIDNKGNYEPSNCRWATAKEQSINRSSNRYFTINGETRCLKEWCEIYNISYKAVFARIYKYNWEVIFALTIPITSRGGTKNGKYAVHS